jgi:hypothetical protein
MRFHKRKILRRPLDSDLCTNGLHEVIIGTFDSYKIDCVISFR